MMDPRAKNLMVTPPENIIIQILNSSFEQFTARVDIYLSIYLQKGDHHRLDLSKMSGPQRGWLRGIVKEVPSGDTVVVMAATKSGIPPEKRLTLASLIAPRLVCCSLLQLICID